MEKVNMASIDRLEQINANQLKTIIELKDRNTALVASGEEMGKEITHLRCVVAGQKGRLKQMAEETRRLKAYAKECDELNERRIAEIDGLKAELCSREKAIGLLEAQVNTVKEAIADSDEEIRRLKDEVVTLEADRDYYKSPWYKKFFNW